MTEMEFKQAKVGDLVTYTDHGDNERAEEIIEIDVNGMEFLLPCRDYFETEDRQCFRSYTKIEFAAPISVQQEMF